MSRTADKVRLHLAVVTGAVAGLGLYENDAQAVYVYSGLVNIAIPTSVDGVYLNVVTGQTGSNAAAVPGWDVNPWSATSLNMFSTTLQAGGVPTAYVGTGTTYFNANIPYVNGPTATFASPGVNTISPGTPLNFNSSNNYIGFRFHNELTGQLHYGWMQILLSESSFSQPRMIVSYAYGDQPNEPLWVPSPSVISILAIGAVGFVGRRRCSGKSA